MLLDEAIESLLLATEANGRSPQTVEGYRRKLKPLQAFLGNVPVEKITVNDLRRYIVHLKERSTRWADHPKHQEREGGLSPFTVASYCRALRRLFNWLQEEGIIQINPAQKIKFPQPKCDKPKSISLEDMLALLETTNGGDIANLRDRAIILFLADTGCRVGGLCGLRIQDVNFEEKEATVREKGDKTRMVPLSQPTADALKDWLSVRPAGHGPWLFVSLGNKAQGRLSPNGVRQMLRRRAKIAGIAGPSNPHAFRHAFGREYLLGGGDLATLSELMGHSDIRVTKESYGIFTFQELKEKHERHSPIARLLGRRNQDGNGSNMHS
jgi:integrase/recombinase XerD